MQKKLENGMQENPEIPSFIIRAKYFPRRYYVLALWKNGREFKITRFQDRLNALQWIEDCSEGWLAEYHVQRSAASRAREHFDALADH